MSGLGCQATTSACFAGTAHEQLPNRLLDIAPLSRRPLRAGCSRRIRSLAT
jgi:hypothetical protein